MKTTSNSVPNLPKGNVKAIVFDLDGVLIDSAPVWERVVRQFVEDHGGTWRDLTPEETMAGGNSDEWSAWFRDTFRLPLSAEKIKTGIIARIVASYREHLPLVPCASQVVERLAANFSLGLASASPLEVIRLVLEVSGMARYFEAYVSADEVAKGKPNPQVYLECCRRLNLPPTSCVAIEDAPDGLRAARSAGLLTIAVPPQHPSATVQNHLLADVQVGSLDEIESQLVACLGAASSCGIGKGIIVVEATPQDYPAVMRLLLGYNLPIEGVSDIKGTGGALFCAKVARTVVGCAGLERHGQDGLLRSLAVSRGFQGRGIGASLVERALAWARNQGLKSVYLLTTTAEEYFVRCGFESVDRSDVPEAIATTPEFSSICPSAARVLALSLFHKPL